jgi:hypothetical protein
MIPKPEFQPRFRGADKLKGKSISADEKPLNGRSLPGQYVVIRCLATIPPRELSGVEDQYLATTGRGANQSNL